MEGGESTTQHGVRNLGTLSDALIVKLENVNPLLLAEECCIHRVPERLHKINRPAYTPSMVSIGPFHNGKQNLQGMEEYKKYYMRALLTRTTTTTTELWTKYNECVESVKRIEMEVRKCYSEPVERDSDKFVEMMVRDGLFIIELFRRKAGEVEIDKNDLLVNNLRILWIVVCDLVKLENQIPMIVLNCLFELSTLHTDEEELQGSSITMLALNFFDALMPRGEDVLKKHKDCVGKHLLDLLRQTFIGIETDENISQQKYIPTATELKHKGMKFKKGSKDNTFVDIKYKGGDKLEFPPVTIIKDRTDFLLGNLIAFEEYSGAQDNLITSYALLMYRLLSSEEDVGLLRKQDIITNLSGKDKDVFRFFEKMAREVYCSSFCYSTLCDQVQLYCNSPWRVWRKFNWQTCYRDFINPQVAITMLVFGYLGFFMHRSPRK